MSCKYLHSVGVCHLSDPVSNGCLFCILYSSHAGLCSPSNTLGTVHLGVYALVLPFAWNAFSQKPTWFFFLLPSGLNWNFTFPVKRPWLPSLNNPLSQPQNCLTQLSCLIFPTVLLPVGQRYLLIWFFHLSISPYWNVSSMMAGTFVCLVQFWILFA